MNTVTRIRVVSPIDRDGVRFEIGNELDLLAHDAASLLECGAAVAVGGVVAEAPAIVVGQFPDPAVPAPEAVVVAASMPILPAAGAAAAGDVVAPAANPDTPGREPDQGAAAEPVAAAGQKPRVRGKKQ
jgi:hypothetical protein